MKGKRAGGGGEKEGRRAAPGLPGASPPGLEPERCQWRVVGVVRMHQVDVVFGSGRPAVGERRQTSPAVVASSVASLYDEVNLVTALVPSDTACLASSPGSMRRTEVWISRDERVAFFE